MARQHRIERVQAAVLANLAELIRSELPEEFASSYTLVRVEVSRDLGHANVYFLSHSDEAPEVATARLQSKAHLLHSYLFRMMHLRTTPLLHFHWDRQTEEGLRLSMALGRQQHERADDE